MRWEFLSFSFFVTTDMSLEWEHLFESRSAIGDLASRTRNDIHVIRHAEAPDGQAIGEIPLVSVVFKFEGVCR